MIDHNVLNELLHKELEELKELSARLQKSIAAAPKGSLHIHKKIESKDTPLDKEAIQKLISVHLL